jgi:hypothetical protein
METPGVSTAWSPKKQVLKLLTVPPLNGKTC